MTQAPDFNADFRARLEELFRWRRDVRHFRSEPLPEGCLERLLALACLAPSVGLSEPWRFVVVESAHRRAAVRANFLQANAQALSSYRGERAERYAALKLAGLDKAPVHLAVFADADPVQGARLGRLTMPQTLAYSVVAAVHTLWLAAAAEGVGMGWLSILDPDALKASLDVPETWTFIGYFCLGYPMAASDTPELERAGWEHRCDLDAVVIKR